MLILFTYEMLNFIRWYTYKWQPFHVNDLLASNMLKNVVNLLIGRENLQSEREGGGGLLLHKYKL